MIIFFLIVLVLIGIRESGYLSNVNNSEITDNINQGTITLFSQNYSEVNSVPSNIFIDKIENTTTLDNVHSTIYGNEKSEIFLDNISKELVYATTRSSSGSSTPSVSHADEILKKGSLYICNFTPMFKCTYEISMGISTD
ncbi:MAG: hypothetical protein Q8910_17190, partial [Bacteroidota bacterium]|nr:hypothetical protein [Bacteroidota bacterium]